MTAAPKLSSRMVRVLVFWDKVAYVAHGVDVDLVVQGRTKCLAVQRFLAMFIGHVLSDPALPPLEKAPATVVRGLGRALDLDIEEAYDALKVMKGPWVRCDKKIVLHDGSFVDVRRNEVEIGEKYLLRFAQVGNVLS